MYSSIVAVGAIVLATLAVVYADFCTKGSVESK
jgi:hypothetical protein